MNPRRLVPALAVGLAIATAVPATVQAQDGGRASIAFTVGLGVGVGPSYFGATSVGAGVTGRLTPHAITLPGGLAIGDPTSQPLDPGFAVRGSFRVIAPRRAADHVELTGLTDIDRAIELGVGVAHVAETWRVFGEARYGVRGHKALVGEVGADVIWRGAQGLTLHAGPRAAFGARGFNQTYFGVTPAESVLSGLAPFDPRGGVISTGLEVAALQDLGGGWGLEGRVRYDRLRGDAGRSPIVAQGSRNQWSGALLLTRRFTFGG